MGSSSLSKSNFTSTEFMAHAIEQAFFSLGVSSPNPAVGAVIINHGSIVGVGNTQPVGSAHAEIMALRDAGDKAQGSEMYVTLEPCSHQGRTPPCVESIISAGIKSVHYAVRDPYDQVNGRGHSMLENAGIEVHVGECEKAVLDQLGGYFKYIKTGLPLVTVKYAASLDGKIASSSGDSHWVSGHETLLWAHKKRPTYDAIIVGSNTVVIDNPQLTARPNNPDGPVDLDVHQPVRIVVDSRGKVDSNSRIFIGDQKSIVVTTELSSKQWRDGIENTGTEVLKLPLYEDTQSISRVDLKALIEMCGQRGMHNILFEGGGVLLGSLFDRQLVDKVHAIIAPIIIGASTAPSAIAGYGATSMNEVTSLQQVEIQPLGNDFLITGVPEWNSPLN